MSKGSLLVTWDPRDACWRLSPLAPSTGRLLLLGWRNDPPAQDGGMSTQIGLVVARALTAVARVTFPTSLPIDRPTDAWSMMRDTDRVRSLGSGTWGERLRAAMGRAPAEIVLLSTQSPDTVVGLFEDPAYPWWLQGQWALLSKLDSPLPDIDRETAVSLFDDEWAERLPLQRVPGLLAVVRPGVDGDVVGVWALHESFGRELLESLKLEAQRAGLDSAVVTEHEMAARLAGQAGSTTPR